RPAELRTGTHMEALAIAQETGRDHAAAPALQVREQDRRSLLEVVAHRFRESVRSAAGVADRAQPPIRTGDLTHCVDQAVGESAARDDDALDRRGFTHSPAPGTRARSPWRNRGERSPAASARSAAR